MSRVAPVRPEHIPYGHYMMTITPGCSCDYRSATIPGEPHLGSYLEAEPDDDCPVHFCDDLISTAATLLRKRGPETALALLRNAA